MYIYNIILYRFFFSACHGAVKTYILMHANGFKAKVAPSATELSEMSASDRKKAKVYIYIIDKCSILIHYYNVYMLYKYNTYICNNYYVFCIL